MKKTISIVLACIMLVACIPLSASAAGTTWSATESKSADYTVVAGDTLTITGAITFTGVLTVNKDASLIIESGAALIITGDSARLANYGTVTVKNGGVLNIMGTTIGASEDNAEDAALYNGPDATLNISAKASCVLGAARYAYNDGTISTIDRMTIGENAIIKHRVTIPENFTGSYRYTETFNRENIDVDFAVKAYQYVPGDNDLAYRSATYDYLTDNKAWVENGNTLFIRIEPEDGDGDWIDTTRMQLVANGQVISAMDKTDEFQVEGSNQMHEGYAVFAVTPTSAVNVTVYSKAYKDIVKIFEVELPRTEAYYTITNNGDVDVVTVEYGKILSFRVVLSEDYDKSDYSVYVNTWYMEPNEYGYYDVTGKIDINDGMDSAGGVQQDISITVMGVAPNSRVDTMNSIVSFIQEIFAVIQEIFGYFLDLFNFGS